MRPDQWQALSDDELTKLAADPDHFVAQDAVTEQRRRAYETAMAELKPGDGVTYCIGSDRYAGTVLKRTPATITITLDDARNTARFPEQRWVFTTNPKREQRTFTRRKDGRYREQGSSCGGLRPGREHYMDPHL